MKLVEQCARALRLNQAVREFGEQAGNLVQFQHKPPLEAMDDAHAVITELWPRLSPESRKLIEEELRDE